MPDAAVQSAREALEEAVALAVGPCMKDMIEDGGPFECGHCAAMTAFHAYARALALAAFDEGVFAAEHEGALGILEKRAAIASGAWPEAKGAK